MKLNSVAKLLGIAFTLTLYGCGGGGDEDTINPVNPPEETQPEDSANGDKSGSTKTYALDGKAADGYLVDAEVCADLNGDGLCNSGEPATFTDGNGAFTLDIPEGTSASRVIVNAIQDLTVDLDSGQAVTGPFTLKAPVTDYLPDVFVSPITTLVANHMQSTNQKVIEASHDVADRLGISIDPLDDFIAKGNQATNSRESEEYQKVHRVSQVLARLEARMRNQLDGNLTQSQEALNIIQQDIAQRSSSISQDIEETLSEAFDPDQQAAEYPTDYVVRDITRGDTEVDRRMAKADMTRNPFFDVYGQLAVKGSVEEVFLTLNRETGKVHFQQVTTEFAADSGEGGVVRLENNAIDVVLNAEGYPEEINTDNPKKDYLVWSNQEGAFMEVQAGHGLGERTYEPAANGSDKMLDGTVYSGAVRTAHVFEGFSLRFINEADVIYELFGKTLPNGLFEGYNTGIYPDNTWAYKTQELFLDFVIVAPWDQVQIGETCSHGFIYEDQMGSCNMLPKATMGDSSTLSATSMADFVYPATYEQTANFVTATHVGTGDDRVMVLTEDGEIHLYPSPAYSTDEFGEIQEAGSFNRSEIVALGSWRTIQQPFTHYILDLPAGYEYGVAQGDFHVGSPILFEQQGYLRNGWRLPVGSTTASALGFEGPRILVNHLTAGRTRHVLKDIGALASTPLDD